MKYFSFLFLLFLGLMVSCEKKGGREADANLNNTESSNLEPGIIPADAKMHDFVFNPQNYSWKDVDAYYKAELQNNNQASYNNNLRKTTIEALVTQFDFLNAADLADIEFYAHELNTIQLPNPEILLQFLNRLEGHWSSAKIASTAQALYSSNMEFVHEKLKNPESYLKKFESKWEQLRTISL